MCRITIGASTTLDTPAESNLRLSKADALLLCCIHSFDFTVCDSNVGTRVIVCGGRIISVLNVLTDEFRRYFNHIHLIPYLCVDIIVAPRHIMTIINYHY